MKIAIIDVETTGLSPTKHEIIELGIVIFDSKTFEILEEWNTKVKPLFPENIDPKAAALNGFNEEEWKDAPDIIPVLMEFIEKTTDCIFLAYNINFDWSFIEYQLNKYEMKHQLAPHKICLMSLAFGKVPHDKVFSWSLRTICSYLGIVPENKIHRGSNGALKNYEVYKKLMQNAA